MTPTERQQSLANAREACEWLKDYFKNFEQEPFEREVIQLIKGFEVLDAKEQAQIAAGAKGKAFGHLGKEYANKPPAPGKKRGRPRKNGGKK